MSVQRNKQGLIIGVSYTSNEVRRPIMTQVIVEKIETLPGNTAGAGSGDFHQYRSLKRREEARVEQMELDYRKKVAQEEFEKLKEAHRLDSLSKTAKKAEKRKKKKERKKKGKQLKAGDCTKKIKIEESNPKPCEINPKSQESSSNATENTSNILL